MPFHEHDSPVIDTVNPPPGMVPFGEIDDGTGRHELVGAHLDALKHHAYLCGATGTGKSTILEHIVYGLARHDQALIVLDPHGALVDHAVQAILSFYPQRARDVLVVDFASGRYPVSFNPLDVRAPSAVAPAVAALRETVQLLLAQQGDKHGQTVSVAEQAIWALCEANVRAFARAPDYALSFVALGAFLTNPELRAIIMAYCTNPSVQQTFAPGGVYDTLGDTQREKLTAPLLRALAALRMLDTFNDVFCQSVNRIDFAAWVRARRLVFVKLPAVMTDTKVASFIGSVTIPTILASLADWGRDPSVSAFLVVDEFQSYASDSYCQILQGGSPLGLHCVSANQIPGDLEPAVLRSVLQHAQSKVAMRLDATAARDISAAINAGQATPSPGDVVALDDYSGWARIAPSHGHTPPPVRFRGLPPISMPGNPRTAHALHTGRRNYEHLYGHVAKASLTATSLPVQVARERAAQHRQIAVQVLRAGLGH